MLPTLASGEAPPTDDGAEVVHVDGGVAGARRQEAAQLGRGVEVGVPLQRVDDLVVLLDAAQQPQAGRRVHFHAPAGREVARSDGRKGNGGRPETFREESFKKGQKREKWIKTARQTSGIFCFLFS